MKNRLTMRRIRDGLFHRYRKLTFRPKIIEREIAGEQIRFLIGDLFGEAAYGLEHTAWPEIDWIKKHCVQPGDTVLDCGANHGFLTVLFAKWVGPTGTVHAFEPSAHNMAILKENLRLNSVSNVVCHQVAVGGTDGTVSISLHPNASIVLNTETDQSLEKVSLVRLDDVLKAETPDFLKLDIEGFEHEALRGASRVLSHIPNLDLELHVSSYKDKLAGLRGAFDMIKLDCYSLFIQTEVDGPIVPFQKEFHTWEALANRDVVHLFCVSKPDCPRR